MSHLPNLSADGALVCMECFITCPIDASAVLGAVLDVSLCEMGLGNGTCPALGSHNVHNVRYVHYARTVTLAHCLRITEVEPRSKLSWPRGASTMPLHNHK